MNVRFRKISPDAMSPAKAYSSDAGYDLYALERTEIRPGEVARIRTGIALEIPEGYFMMIVPRSGYSYKTSLRIPNSPGIIDSEYRGEIMVLMQNTSSDPFGFYTINRGDRIAQMILRKLESYTLTESDILCDSERSDKGFGSSGM